MKAYIIGLIWVWFSVRFVSAWDQIPGKSFNLNCHDPKKLTNGLDSIFISLPRSANVQCSSGCLLIGTQLEYTNAVRYQGYCDDCRDDQFSIIGGPIFFSFGSNNDMWISDDCSKTRVRKLGPFQRPVSSSSSAVEPVLQSTLTVVRAPPRTSSVSVPTSTFVLDLKTSIESSSFSSSFHSTSSLSNTSSVFLVVTSVTSEATITSTFNSSTSPTSRLKPPSAVQSEGFCVSVRSLKFWSMSIFFSVILITKDLIQ